MAEETAVAKGIRRITGATGASAMAAKEAAHALDSQYHMIRQRMQKKEGAGAIDIDQIDTEIITLR